MPTETQNAGRAFKHRSWDLTQRIVLWASLGVMLIGLASYSIHRFHELPQQMAAEQKLDRWLIKHFESSLAQTATALQMDPLATSTVLKLNQVGKAPLEVHVRERVGRLAPEQEHYGIFRIGSELKLYYAKLNGSSVHLWSRSIDGNLLSAVTDRVGLKVDWVSHQYYFEELNALSLKTGTRSPQGDFLYWALLDDSNTPALFAKLQLPPRQFHTRSWNAQAWIPTVLGISLVLLGAWYMRRRITWPLRELEMQLQRLSRSEHYRSDLPLVGAAPEIKRLAISCSNMLERINDRTEELKTYSYTDALTGLGNRRAIDERRDALWGMCRRQKVFISALVFDLDYFKQYNDSYGHEGGDQVLVDFASILREHFARSSDVIARSGGEEFIALLFDTHSDAALLLANRVIKSLEQKAIVHRSSPISRYLTCSAGVASMIPAEEEQADTLINMADKALYRAKAQGRNRAIAFKKANIVKFDGADLKSVEQNRQTPSPQEDGGED